MNLYCDNEKLDHQAMMKLYNENNEIIESYTIQYEKYKPEIIIIYDRYATTYNDKYKTVIELCRDKKLSFYEIPFKTEIVKICIIRNRLFYLTSYGFLYEYISEMLNNEVKDIGKWGNELYYLTKYDELYIETKLILFNVFICVNYSKILLIVIENKVYFLSKNIINSYSSSFIFENIHYNIESIITKKNSIKKIVVDDKLNIYVLSNKKVSVYRIDLNDEILKWKIIIPQFYTDRFQEIKNIFYIKDYINFVNYRDYVFYKKIDSDEDYGVCQTNDIFGNYILLS